MRLRNLVDPLASYSEELGNFLGTDQSLTHMATMLMLSIVNSNALYWQARDKLQRWGVGLANLHIEET